MKITTKIYMLIAMMLVLSGIAANAETLDNVLNCEVIKTADLSTVSDMQPILYVMSNSESENPVGNAHVANYTQDLGLLGLSAAPNHVLVCGAGEYGDVGAIVVGAPGCEKTLPSVSAVAVINMSDKVNAHIQIADPNDAVAGSVLSPKYTYQLCMYPISQDYTGAIFCQTKYTDCGDTETELFKFTGALPSGSSSYEATNAHFYEPAYTTTGSTTNYYHVCCRYVVGAEGDVIVDISPPISSTSSNLGLTSTSSEKELYVIVGLTDYFVIKLFNPSTTPRLVDLYLESGNQIFNNFIWLGDEANKYAEDPRHIQLTIPPKQYRSVIVNVFGGKVGVYDLVIKKRINGDPATEDVLYNTTVTIIPGRVEGTIESSPEGSYALLILSLGAMLLYLIK